MTISAAYPAACIPATALPDFDEYGFLPSGVYDTTIQEVQRRFCTNEQRVQIFSRFEDYVNEVSVFGMQFACYLDGSFISDKDDPQDLDVVIDIPDSNSQLYNALRSSVAWHDRRWLLLNLEKVRREFGIHFFYWMPMMQVRGPNDQIENFQKVYAATATDVRSRKGIKVELSHRKGIVRVIV